MDHAKAEKGPETSTDTGALSSRIHGSNAKQVHSTPLDTGFIMRPFSLTLQKRCAMPLTTRRLPFNFTLNGVAVTATEVASPKIVIPRKLRRVIGEV